MNLKSYIMKNYDKKIIVNLKELATFLPRKPSKAELKKNPLQYSVFTLARNGFDISLTILNGAMTRGHYHKISLPEIYILIRGKAAILLKNKETRRVVLKKNIPFVIPCNLAHRVINLAKKTEFITFCLTSAGHVYKKIKF